MLRDVSGSRHALGCFGESDFCIQQICALVTCRQTVSGGNNSNESSTVQESPLFSGRYGSLSDLEFVTLLYSNVLKRTPEAGGLAFYLDGLANQVFSRARILASFSESPENRVLTRTAMEYGIAYLPVTGSGGNGN